MKLVIYIVSLCFLWQNTQQFVVQRSPAIKSQAITTEEVDETTPTNDETTTVAKSKRCSRPEIVGSVRLSEMPLSLSRRDLKAVDRLRTQCEFCRNSALCKKHNLCKSCDIVCNHSKSLETTTPNPEDKSEVPEVATRNGNDASLPENPDKDQRILTSSRLSEDPEEKSQYETLGAIQQGPTMNLLAKLLNISNRDSFEHLIVLGKLKTLLNNSPNNAIIDKAHVFGSNVPKIFPEDLSNAIHEAIEKKKQELNQDSLSQNQIEQIVEQVAAAEPETQTRCALEDEVDEVFNVLPAAIPARQQPIPAEKNEEESFEEEERAKVNPPVIQDKAFLLGEEEAKTEANMPLDKEETKTRNNFFDSNEENGGSSSDSMSLEQFRQNEDGKNKIEAPQVGEPEIEEGLDDQIIDTVQDDPRSQPHSDNILKDPNEEPANNLQDNIFKVVKDSLKIPSNNASAKNADQTPLTSNDLEKNIMKVVDDSLRTTDNNAPVLEAIEEQSAPEEAASGPSRALEDSIIDEIPQAMENVANELLQPDDGTNPAPEETNDVPQDVPTVSLQENNPDFQEPASASQETNPELQDPSLAIQEANPDLQVRSEFPKESYQNFGALVPAAHPDGSPAKKVFFVGKDINLPLQMVKDENGILQLTVDMDKLCHCKNVTCTRKHLDSVENAENSVKMESPDQQELPELQVDFGTPENDENHTNIKRSPKISEKNDMVSKINPNYEFPVEKLEKELQRIDKEVKEFNKENENLLREETLALVKNVETTENVERMVGLAHTVLEWMKDLSINK